MNTSGAIGFERATLPTSNAGETIAPEQKGSPVDHWHVFCTVGPIANLRVPHISLVFREMWDTTAPTV